jgi:oleandomycin transport system ATP-binding protein
MAKPARGASVVCAACAGRVSGRGQGGAVTEYAIQAEGLSKRYGTTTALDRVDLTVAPGAVLGLLGPNGAGKTTLIRILATLVRATAGTARVGGFAVHAQPARVRELIGLTGQFATVDDGLTGIENLVLIARLLELPRRTARARAAELLERFELADAAGRRVSTYSGGMRRRLDIAASLIGRPRLLFLDEPTTGLDPRGRSEVWDLVRGLAADGTTVLLTTQYLDEADRLASDIAVIDHGRIVATGTPAQLKARVGGQTLEVRPADRGALSGLTALVATVAGAPATVDIERGVVSAPLATAASTVLRAVADALDAAGVEATEVGIRLATLDEVFLTLTEVAA